MFDIRKAAAAVIVGVAAVAAQGQSITLTGFVGTDFAGRVLIPDPGGQDVAMPVELAGNVSGWDLSGLALHYDAAIDTLFVGLDAYGIFGDADGNGNAGAAGSALQGLGGLDRSNLKFGESFCVTFDFDGDGAADVMVGVQPGQQLADIKACYAPAGMVMGSALQTTWGAPIPNQLAVGLGSPFSGCPDLEFWLPNFCELLNQFAQPGLQAIGVHVIAGSLDDGPIGNDVIAGATDADFVQVPLTAFDGADPLPVLNNYRVKSIAAGPGANYSITTEYGISPDYGCCILYSLAPNPVGWTIGAPVNLTVNIGTFTEPTYAVDVGVPADVQGPCVPKEALHVLPAVIADVAIYAQIIAYHVPYQPGQPDQFRISNVIALLPDMYPTLP